MDLTIWKKAKKEKHLSYEDIARLSSVPITTVKNVFCGYTTTPRIDTVEAIEKALGIGNNTLEWTDEDKALGVGNHPTFLSDREREWLELGSEVLRIRGEDYYKVLKKMIEAAIKLE